MSKTDDEPERFRTVFFPLASTLGNRSLRLLGVPTQIIATSECFTASSTHTVAFKRPLVTIASTRSARPGSITGDSPVLIIATLSGLTSTPNTSCPALARQAAVTDPT